MISSRVPAALKKVLDRFDTKFYFGSVSSDDRKTAATGSLPEVILRFESELGNTFLSHFPDPLLSAKLAFRKYVAQPLFTPLVISAFGRHLKDSDAYEHWTSHHSGLYDVRINSLLSQFTPDVDTVATECSEFVWDDKETADSLNRRADALAKKFVASDLSFRSYSEEDRAREKDRKHRELLTSALRSYPVQFADITSWTVAHDDGNLYPIADLVRKMKGHMTAIQRLKKSGRLSSRASPSSLSSSSTTSDTSAPTSDPSGRSNRPSARDRHADREKGRKSKIAHTLLNIALGDTEADSVNDKDVLAAPQSAEKRGFNFKRKCFNCAPFVGIVPQITRASNESHLQNECPHRDVIQRLLGQVQAQAQVAALSALPSSAVSHSPGVAAPSTPPPQRH